VVYRARAKSVLEPTPLNPAATILPSDWMATAAASSAEDPMGVVTVPPEPKLGSRSPGAAMAARAVTTDPISAMGKANASR
jgi:hypothetical protein